MSADRTATRQRLTAGLLAAVGVLNLAPGVLAFRPDRLPQAYGVRADTPALALLLRHRAALLGLVGAGLTASVRHPALRGPAMLAAAVSKVSFLALVGSAPPTAELRRVARADALGLTGLVLAAALDRRCPRLGTLELCPSGWGRARASGEQLVRGRRTR